MPPSGWMCDEGRLARNPGPGDFLLSCENAYSCLIDSLWLGPTGVSICHVCDDSTRPVCRSETRVAGIVREDVLTVAGAVKPPEPATDHLRIAGRWEGGTWDDGLFTVTHPLVLAPPNASRSDPKFVSTPDWGPVCVNAVIGTGKKPSRTSTADAAVVDAWVTPVWTF